LSKRDAVANAAWNKRKLTLLLAFLRQSILVAFYYYKGEGEKVKNRGIDVSYHQVLGLSRRRKMYKVPGDVRGADLVLCQEDRNPL